MNKFILLFSLLFSSCFAFAQKQWTLQECVNYALQNNLQVLQSGLTKWCLMETILRKVGIKPGC